MVRIQVEKWVWVTQGEERVGEGEGGQVVVHGMRVQTAHGRDPPLDPGTDKTRKIM